MTTLLLTVLMISFLMLAMSVGVLFSNRELKGSCGGATADCACEAAGKPRTCEYAPGDEPEECEPVGIGNPSRVPQS
jgi:hypothetical protein